MVQDFLEVTKMQQQVTWEKVRSSQDYREFLKNYIEEKSIRVADFARAAGCHRGFPADVISGKRRITTKSYYAFEQALRLPADGKKMFRYLVAMGEPDFLPELDRAKIAASLASIRQKSWGKTRRNLKETGLQIQDVLQNTDVPLVFSATGGPETGASFSDIQIRTKKSPEDLQQILGLMVNIGLLKNVDDKYYSQDMHLFWQGIDQKKAMTTLFQKYCLAASAKAEQKWSSEKELFFFSNLCVQESQLPQLKKALRETIMTFVDESLQPDGDCVVKLSASMFI